jgi:murein DD-endopeptidase MepM/ murein hydrolase activator NlpD
VRLLGPQSAISSVKLNTPVQVRSADGEMLSHVYDLSRGKYDLTVETGPSFTTRREEAASQMTELIRAYPAAAPVLGDLLAKNLDWPDADEIAKRLQSLLPAAANDNAPANALAAKLQQQVALLSAQLQGLQSDRSLDAEKLRIEAYKAETDRLKLTAMARPNKPVFSAAAQKPRNAVLPSGGGEGMDFQSSETPEGESEGPSFAPLPNPSNVYSLSTGRVSRAGYQDPGNDKVGLGWRVWVTESDGSQTGYGHMDPRTTPPVGTQVEVGDHIGNFANPTNGESTGPHVHVQRFDPSGKLADPGVISPLFNGIITTRFGKNVKDPTHPAGHSGIDFVPRPQ